MMRTVQPPFPVLMILSDQLRKARAEQSGPRPTNAEEARGDGAKRPRPDALAAEWRVA
jgi:hypothetical protein